MGGSPQQQTQQGGQTVTAPWGPAAAPLRADIKQIQAQMGNTGVQPGETSAFQNLLAQYASGNPYANAIGASATDMLGGGPDLTGGVNAAYDQYARQVMPWASGAMGDPSTNPALAALLARTQADVSSNINSTFAGAGRDLSGYNSKAVARGLAEGEAPTLLNAQQLGLQTAENLYGAGNTTAGLLSNLASQRFANQQAGVGQAANALGANMWGPQGILSTLAAQRQLPLSNIANINSLLLPIAGLGGQSTSSGQSTTSTQVPWWQQAVGAAAALGGTAAKFANPGMAK